MTKTGSADETSAKTNLKWRLTKAPTLEDVQSLLKSNIISKDEARQMLFSEVNKDEQIKSLEEQVTFLKGVIDKLAQQPPHNVWTYVQGYQPKAYWGNTPTVLCSAIGNIANNETSRDGNSITYSLTTGNTGGALFKPQLY